MTLVEIGPPAFDVELTIAYASADNFTSKPVYARPGCYLHPDAAACLATAIKLARAQGLKFRIFDAFRPAEAQWALWRHTPDPEFLADPNRGSPHSMGAAVDLTLIDGSGRDLDMGTAFDAFTPRSHHGDLEIPVAAQRNRAILLGIMTAAGWDFFRNEWWHYQLFNPRGRYPVLGDAALPTPMMPAGTPVAPNLKA
ncbi:MAG: D-alanyl-D-alanine dipeptidase [Alphaproteobacteria bacterium]|nr:D-alanyl-D-alanine dipeptidase [Alphaproteobacteria bacterium]